MPFGPAYRTWKMAFCEVRFFAEGLCIIFKSLQFMSASRHLHRLLHAAVFRLQGWSMLLLAVPGMSSHVVL